jgi:hypothetical protein
VVSEVRPVGDLAEVASEAVLAEEDSLEEDPAEVGNHSHSKIKIRTLSVPTDRVLLFEIKSIFAFL